MAQETSTPTAASSALRLGALAAVLAANYSMPATAGTHCDECVNFDNCLYGGFGPSEGGTVFGCQSNPGGCLYEDSCYNWN